MPEPGLAMAVYSIPSSGPWLLSVSAFNTAQMGLGGPSTSQQFLTLGNMVLNEAAKMLWL